MKKLISLILVFAVLLCGCVVGPEENPREPLVSPDIVDVPVEPEPPVTTLPEDAVDPIEPTEPDDTPDVDPEPDVTEPAPVEDPVTTPDLDFDIDMYDAEETMYSTISLNVRSGPSVDFESIGSLREGQEATVVGRASTGWYMIEFNGGYGYVSGSYMTYDNPNPEPEPEPEPTDWPQLDPLDHAAMATIIEDYAEFSGSSSESVIISGYYGAYDAGEAVLMIDTEKSYTADMYYFTVAGYDFGLASGGLRIHIHRPDGFFIELGRAYEQGLLSVEDVVAIHYYYSAN